MKDITLLPFDIFKTVIQGWIHLIQIFFQKIRQFFESKSLPEKWFFCFLIIQVATSAVGWVEYKIVFNDSEEIIRLSVGWNVFFILGSLVNFFFTGFWRASWVWVVFLFIQTGLLILFAWGSFQPDLAFTNIMKKSDYQFSIGYYIFALAIFLSWALGIAIYLEDKKKSRLLV